MDELERLKQENAELRAALKKALTPEWFYHPDYMESCNHSPLEVIDNYYDPEPGKYVLEIECARGLPSIWCAVHCLSEEDQEEIGTDDRFIIDEFTTYEEAKAKIGV